MESRGEEEFRGFPLPLLLLLPEPTTDSSRSGEAARKADGLALPPTGGFIRFPT